MHISPIKIYKMDQEIKYKLNLRPTNDDQAHRKSTHLAVWLAKGLHNSQSFFILNKKIKIFYFK
jgi:hypothetical protein